MLNRKFILISCLGFMTVSVIELTSFLDLYEHSILRNWCWPTWAELSYVFKRDHSAARRLLSPHTDASIEGSHLNVIFTYVWWSDERWLFCDFSSWLDPRQPVPCYRWGYSVLFDGLPFVPMYSMSILAAIRCAYHPTLLLWRRSNKCYDFFLNLFLASFPPFIWSCDAWPQ